MKLSKSGEVSVYTVSGANVARPLPDWLIKRRKRSLKNDAEFQNRVELLQDFEFPEASNCVRVSEDGNWVMSTGTYKTSIHVHSTADLSLSYERHTTSENLTFQFLSTDASKSLHLQVDRSLQFHTLAGCLYSLRIPRFGRDLQYVREQTEAIIPAVGLAADGSGLGEVFRLNLERGQFMKSYQVDVGGDAAASGLQGSIDVGAVNVAAVAERSHGLLAFGTSIGTIEFFDPRMKTRVATLGNQEGEITALDFNTSGLTLATGSSTGVVKIFDLRRPQPQLTRDHGSGFPIKSLKHITTASQERLVLAADKSAVKIFGEQKGEVFCSITPLVDINHVEVVPNTGMVFSANEGSPLHTWFIPSIGPAPRWCSFLDNMADEMEQEVQTETFDNYKFLTLPEMKSLNLMHLVGNSSLLKPYMGGYFINQKLYEQARLIANPFMWEEERAKRVKEKIEKERATRIRGNKKVRVNQKLADRLLKKQEKRGNVDNEAGVLGDSRFTSLFEDEEFAVDENSKEFKMLNPSTKIEGDDGLPKKGPVNDSNSSGDESSDDNIRPPEKSDKGVEMRVSSSKTMGGRSKDTVLGSRSQKSGRISKARQDVVGEKHVTFMPQAKKARAPAPSAPTKRSEGRRSASSNTFRNL